MSLINHCWNEWKRFEISRLEGVTSIDGSMMISTTIGKPITVGVMKEANKFSFILFLMDCLFSLASLILLRGFVGSYRVRFLVV